MHSRRRIGLSTGLITSLAWGLAGGCLDFGGFNCSDNAQCLLDGMSGFCQPATGFCSYPDMLCATGFRYGEEAGDGLGGECVEPAVATTSTTAPPTTSDPESSSSTEAESSSTEDPVATEPPTTGETDPGTETGDTCGSPGQPCCGDGTCDADLSCFADVCGCVNTLAAGDAHNCITKVDGTVWCWGANDTGQLGVAGITSSPVPLQAADALLGGAGLRALEVDAFDHTCALREDGQAVCWGENATGGSSPTLPSATPAVPAAIALVEGAVQPAVGAGFSCFSFPLGGAFVGSCFGSNNVGQLTGVETPGPVNIKGAFTVAELVGGVGHVCGRTAMGEMYCWGNNASGQLGVTPLTVPFSTTVRQILISPVGDIAVGRDHSCARVANQVQCWGANALGQLGDGTTTPSLTPITALIPEVPILRLSSGSDTICAIQGTGEVYCWGDNTGDKLLILGQTKNDAFAATPVLIDILADAVPVTIETIEHGAGHGCVLTDQHDVMCWGLNAEGQVGNGIPSAQVLEPTTVDITCP